jgi:hypothetical protein
MLERNRFADSHRQMPTPAEIRRQCEEIQRRWSPQEWAQRAGWQGDRFVPPHLRLLRAVANADERRERVA